MDHHSSNHDKSRVKLEPDRSPEHGMALLTVDSGSSGAPPQASQEASSSSSTPAPSTSTETNNTSTSKEGRNRGPRRFICNYPDCDKTFTTSGHLARHVRVHTGEKAFQCTFPGCESRFSRHDNMLQHYRNHIVRNARRRKKAFASAVASGSVGLTSKDFYDGNSDTSPSTSYAPLPSTSTSGQMGLYPPPSSSYPPSLNSLSGPIFVHSSYSTLSHLGGPSRLSAAAAAAAASSNASSSAFFETGVGSSSSSTSGNIAARRQPAMSPLLQLPQASSSSSFVSPSTAAGPSDSRDTPFAGALGGGGHHLTLPTSAPPSSSSFLSPPLASPSVMDRPHTATTSFFPLSIGGSGSSGTVTIQPPPLMHRHSYSALASQPVLEPITPTSELPSYPAYHTHPQAVNTPGPQYEQQQQYYFHQQSSQHQPQLMPTYAHSPYPLSPGLESVPGDYSYSPTLSAAASTTYAASPRMIDGTLATLSQDQQATYFSLPPSVLGGETLYNTELYGPPTASSTASSAHNFQSSQAQLQSQRQNAPMPSATYPPAHAHSNNFPSSSAQNLHPHHAGSTPLVSTSTASFPSPVISRNTISHSSLGSHNPLLSGLGLAGDDDLTTSTRSSSLSTSIGTSTNASHLVPPSEAATTPGEVNYTTSGSGPSSIVGTARWLRSPSAATDYASAQGHGQGHLQGHSQSHLAGSMDYNQGHAGWQPDMSGDYIMTTTQTSDNYHASTPSSLASIPSAPSSVIGDQQTLSMADPDERAYRQAVLEDQAFGFHEQVTWGPYKAEP